MLIHGVIFLWRIFVLLMYFGLNQVMSTLINVLNNMPRHFWKDFYIYEDLLLIDNPCFLKIMLKGILYSTILLFCTTLVWNVLGNYIILF